MSKIALEDRREDVDKLGISLARFQIMGRGWKKKTDW